MLLESKFELPLFSGFNRLPIQLVVFGPVGLSSFLRHPTRPSEDVVRTTESLQERTLIEQATVKPGHTGNFSFDSN